MLSQTRRVAFPGKLSHPEGGVNFTQVIFEDKNGCVKILTAQPSNNVNLVLLHSKHNCMVVIIHTFMCHLLVSICICSSAKSKSKRRCVVPDTSPSPQYTSSGSGLSVITRKLLDFRSQVATATRALTKGITSFTNNLSTCNSMGRASSHSLYLRKGNEEFWSQEKSRAYIFLETGGLGKRVGKKKEIGIGIYCPVNNLHQEQNLYLKTQSKLQKPNSCKKFSQ